MIELRNDMRTEHQGFWILVQFNSVTLDCCCFINAMYGSNQSHTVTVTAMRVHGK